MYRLLNTENQEEEEEEPGAIVGSKITLYYHNRNLNKIPLFPDTYLRLKRLFLSNNKIHNLSGMEQLHLLEELDVSYNYLRIISNLHHNHRLRMLNLDSQLYTSKFTRPKFLPHTLETLKNSLHTLSCQSNNIKGLNEMTELKNIKTLDLANNNLQDIIRLSNDLSNFPNLTILNLKYNDVCKDPNYKKLILGCPQIKITRLDDCEICPAFRRHYITLNKNVPNSSDLVTDIVREEFASLPRGVREDVESEFFYHTGRNKKL